MIHSMLSRFGLLAKREMVLVFFLLAKTASAVFDGLTVSNTETWGFGIITLLVYLIIAWFAYTRQIISVWAISMIMLYEASGPFLNTLKIMTATPMDNTIMNVLTLAVSGYILFGALVIFQSRHRCE